MTAGARRSPAGELSPARRRLLRQLVAGTAVLGVGAGLGVALAPESPADARTRVAELEVALAAARSRIAELEWTVKHPVPAGMVGAAGKLAAEDRRRHEREARRYAAVLRQVKAQSAAELIEWFVTRWNAALDRPSPEDRTGRRAELLSLLIGGMAANLDPGDYVPWQAEFLNGTWLGELHFDLDGDGLPGKRARPNPRDGFAATSVCHIAMALNQAARDARVLVMPEMRCDRPEARISLFLQGATLDAALDEFARGLEREGFLVVEREEKGVRLILVGPGNRVP